MESIYIELALHGSKNKCVSTDNVYFTISEVCNFLDLSFKKIVQEAYIASNYTFKKS